MNRPRPDEPKPFRALISGCLIGLAIALLVWPWSTLASAASLVSGIAAGVVAEAAFSNRSRDRR